MLTIEFFRLDYNEVIFLYAKQDYSLKSLDSMNYIDEFYIFPLREEIILWAKNIEPILGEDIEVVEEDQVLQQIDEFKLKDNTFQQIEK